MSTKIRIAVSGTGGGVGQSIIKALAGTDYEVVALDGEALGTGLYAAPSSYLIPYAKDPNFIDRVLEICQKEQCQLYFPGLDAELPFVSQAMERFTAIGTQAVVSRPEIIELSDNKLLTYQSLSKLGVDVPETIDLSDYSGGAISLEFPYILKKRSGGARSQGLHIIENAEQLDRLVQGGLDLKPYIAQAYIEGDEYTCGSINLDGECKGVIVMRRILRDGDTYKCFSVKHEAIEDQVRKLLTVLKPFGACNVQLRLKNGVPYVFEINARHSGTTAARALCGFNEPKLIADFLCRQIEPEYTITEQTILRYWNELTVANEAVAELSSQGQLHTNNGGKL